VLVDAWLPFALSGASSFCRGAPLCVNRALVAELRHIEHTVQVLTHHLSTLNSQYAGALQISLDAHAPRLHTGKELTAESLSTYLGSYSARHGLDSFSLLLAMPPEHSCFYRGLWLTSCGFMYHGAPLGSHRSPFARLMHALPYDEYAVVNCSGTLIPLPSVPKEERYSFSYSEHYIPFRTI
jgi:hypothetical protein